MEYFDLIQKRHSVRAYNSKSVEDEKINKILEAALLAPTACNRQSFKVVVLKTKDHEEELKKIYARPFFTEAPIVIGIFSDYESNWKRSDGKNYGDVDASIVMDHIILAATALGLGSCWVANFNPEAAREVIGLGEGYEPIAFTPIGYAEPSDYKKNRKSLGEVVVYI